MQKPTSRNKIRVHCQGCIERKKWWRLSYSRSVEKDLSKVRFYIALKVAVWTLFKSKVFILAVWLISWPISFVLFHRLLEYHVQHGGLHTLKRWSTKLCLETHIMNMRSIMNMTSNNLLNIGSMQMLSFNINHLSATIMTHVPVMKNI